MEEDEYILKRKKNNQSVKKCRENEKRKIELAQMELEEYKKENKLLDEKYTSLQKELAVLKSLFIQNSCEKCEDSESPIIENLNSNTTSCHKESESVARASEVNNESDLSVFELDIFAKNLKS